MVVAVKWERPLHINVLEAQAVLTALKWRLRKAGRVGTRFVVLGGLSGDVGSIGSTSQQMKRVLRRINAMDEAPVPYGVTLTLVV